MLFRVSRSWPVCALNTSQNLSPCSVLASEVIFVTAGKMFGLKVQWCKLFWQISPLFWLFLFWIYHDVWCCYNDQRHEDFHYCQGKSILIRPKSDHCLPLLYRNKSWSNFIIRISTKYQLQNLNYTSGSRLHPVARAAQMLGETILPRAGYRLGTYRTVDIFNFSHYWWAILEKRRFLCF